MKKNVGVFDSTLRVLVAIGIGILYLNDVISGTLAIVLISVAVILTLTSFFGFCPLYSLLGFNTCTVKKKSV